MKKLILISFLFISTGIYSQGNLQFNKVINLEYTKVLNGTASVSGNSVNNGETLLQTVTIEENKVWKVVSAAITGGDRFRGGNPLNPYTDYDVGLFLNKTKIYQSSVGTNASEKFRDVSMPIWFSSGTKNIITYMYGTDSDPITISISIIEFNVVP